MDSNSVEGGLDGLLGGTVKHFVSDGSGVGVPANKDKLRGRASVLGFEFQVDETVSGLVFRKLIAEIVVGGVTFTEGIDFDQFLVLDFVNVEAQLLVNFERLEGGINFLVDCNTAL